MAAIRNPHRSAFRTAAPLAVLLLLMSLLVVAPRADAELPAAIKGQVLSELDPIGYARVKVFDAASGAAIKSALTDAEGYYLIGGLPPGPVKVRASKAGYLNSWASGMTSKATASVYTLLPGQTLEQTWDEEQVLYLDLAPESVVTGTVMGDPWDNPLGGVKVTAFNAATGKRLGSTVTADPSSGDGWGSFRIGKLPAGDVKLRASKSGYFTTWMDAKWTKATADTVSVQPYAPTDIGVFWIYEPAAIEGLVTVDDEPIAKDVKVTVFDALTGKAIRSVVDDDGYFRIDGLPPVPGQDSGDPSRGFKVRASGPFYTTSWATGEQTRQTAEVFTVLPGQVLQNVFINVSQAGSIQGQVLGHFDPLGYAKVKVFDAATGTALRSGRADGDGNYRIDKIPVGFGCRDIKVRASKDGWVSSWANGATSKATADSFQLCGGQTLEQSWDPHVLYLDLTPLPPAS